jgi:hypothetical protein
VGVIFFVHEAWRGGTTRASCRAGKPYDPYFEVDAQDFTAQGRGVQIGLPPYRIDILTSIDGLTFEEAIDGHALEHHDR